MERKEKVVIKRKLGLITKIWYVLGCLLAAGCILSQNIYALSTLDDLSDTHITIDGLVMVIVTSTAIVSIIFTIAVYIKSNRATVSGDRLDPNSERYDIRKNLTRKQLKEQRKYKNYIDKNFIHN